MTDYLQNAADIEAVIGKTPPAINLKVIDHLDASALQWLGLAQLAFASFCRDNTPKITLGGGDAGFASGTRQTLTLPLACLDEPALAVAGASVGSLFLVPGLCETLRINGTVEALNDKHVSISVAECYLHCGKALIRSAFWEGVPVEDTDRDITERVEQSRFMALATVNSEDEADLSPKGDPARQLTGLVDGQLVFADRPGNKRVDSFRNIVSQPRIAGALLIPGSNQVATFTGRAALTTRQQQRERLAVDGRTPKLAIEVEDLSLESGTSAALERARLWQSTPVPPDIEPGKVFAAHIRANKKRSIGARVAAAAVSVPGLMQRGLDKDYEDNLY